MNYRHAFHAGNFADCFKHALLVALLDVLARKPTPFCVMDTHAGSGRYDLSADAARKTEEAQGGILRLLANQDGPSPLSPYLDLIGRLEQFRADWEPRSSWPGLTGPSPSAGEHFGNVPRWQEMARSSRAMTGNNDSAHHALRLYPGSPLIIRSLLRPDDRLICCEKHPEEVATLKRLFRDDGQVEVHARSGWEAMGALLPPKQKRGLVFIDPPYEERDEFATLVAALKTGHARFGHGVFAAWYPIKRLAAVRGFHADMKAAGIRDIIAIDMCLRDPTDPERMNGCGLLVINPPYRFAETAETLAQAVLAGLGTIEPGAGEPGAGEPGPGEPGAGVQTLRIADE